MSLYSSLFYSEKANALLTESRSIVYMLEVERQAALAQAKCGFFPNETAEIISTCCKVELINIDQLISEIPLGGNAAIPLVQQLSKLVKLRDFEASRYVHFGLTSQDVVDTATVLCIKDLIVLLEEGLADLTRALVNKARKYKETPMIGRTLLQQAKPITFGYKLVTYIGMIESLIESLASIKKRVLKIQLGGAVGSGNNSITKEVQKEFAKNLELNLANSWQSDRTSINEFGAFLGTLSGSLGKIAKDISLLMQTEIAEVFEGAAEGKGGSSTMPHKRNPISSAVIIANATRTPHLVATLQSAMLQEHERSAGLWHAEWETLNTLMGLSAGSLEKTVDLISHLEVKPEQMAHNLEQTNGLIYAENVSLALAQTMGKLKAHDYVTKACKKAISQKIHLLDILKEQKTELSDIEKYFTPSYSLGSAIRITNEVLDKYEDL
ncbi:class-II fumarase/aspartase family protein [Jiulongibacter sp. NS-SX5]|uniref:class-II fumarase/aspartase family protein n=1 Tax=Jiulongibacter sp. NS-SX5 TaxID=3463854 RepID=UPI0040585F35